MARVNHKLVKQRLNEKRSKITDSQFFSSRLLAGHFEDMAAAQTRRYKYNRRVHVNLIWDTKSPITAMTNNQIILINCGHKLVTQVRGRENRYQVVCGMFAHELGHVLYTDFLGDQTHLNLLAQYKWFPRSPLLKTNADIRNEAAFWDYVKDSPENLEAVQYVASEIGNVIEDGSLRDVFLHPKQDLTKKFVGGSLEAISTLNSLALDKLGKNEAIYQLVYSVANVTKSIIIELYKQIGVEVSMLYGNVELLNEEPIGTLVVLVKGDPAKQKQTQEFLAKQNVTFTRLDEKGNVYHD